MAFLVIEGLDGSGKSTQIKLLREYLVNKAIIYKFIHFPRTESGIIGDLIAMFLRGELGKIDEVNPYLVAMIYAADRQDAKKEMLNWLEEGHLLLVDRYVMSNVAFQCAKLSTTGQKRLMKDWIFQLEFTKYEIPRPDLNIFLDVPFEFTREKLSNSRSGNERDYLKGRQDIHESDLNFQKKVREIYLEHAETDENLRVIECYDNQKEMLNPEIIFSRIKELLEKEKFLNI